MLTQKNSELFIARYKSSPWQNTGGPNMDDRLHGIHSIDDLICHIIYLAAFLVPTGGLERG